jgi:hypothetical protein
MDSYRRALTICLFALAASNSPVTHQSLTLIGGRLALMRRHRYLKQHFKQCSNFGGFYYG